MHSSSQRTDGIGISSNVFAQVNVEEESAPVPQRVLGEAFCINRLDRIRKLAGKERLKDFINGSNREDREKEITLLFKRFLRENVKDGPSYFCVSADVLWRMIHTFKEEYVARTKALESSVELDLHVNDIVEQVKESMSQDANAIRMQTQNFIDKKNRLLLDALPHEGCIQGVSVTSTCLWCLSSSRTLLTPPRFIP
jgi:hypothetical protein